MPKFTLHTEVHFRTLDALGIRYAALHETDGRGKLLILTKAEVEKHFSTMFDGLLSDDEAKDLREQLDAIDLAADWTALAEKIANYSLTDAPIAHDFQPCECGMPIKHGHIVDSKGQKLLDEPVVSLFDCIIQTHVLIDNEKFDANTGIALMKKGLEYDLPKNKEEEEARFNALPAEVREEFERRMMANNPLSILILSALGTK